jgi:hypothetical protein
MNLIPEYNQTTTVDLAAGTTMNASLPEWTPADIPFATTIDYLINASVSMNMSDEVPTDNELTKVITLSYEHDVGVIEITQPPDDLHYLGNLPVEGIIQNFGVTYSESNFPVNAQLTNDTGEVVYDETIIVTNQLEPGAITTVTFPDIPDNVTGFGDFKLTMRTQLVGDDHPNNDKTIKTWYVPPPPDTTPPVTTATVSGTMGQNYWYVSCVTVTIQAIDGKWPSGVNCTYYKIDDGDWGEYTVPIVVCSDGAHTVYFYSDDHAGNVEAIQSVSFKIDQTVPSITMSVEKVGFRQWKFIAAVTDETSGTYLVLCFIDDQLLGNITTPGPYEWTWNGKGNHTVAGIAYDYAGNSAENTVTFSLDLSQRTTQSESPFIYFFTRLLERFPDAFPILRSLLLSSSIDIK